MLYVAVINKDKFKIANWNKTSCLPTDTSSQRIRMGISGRGRRNTASSSSVRAETADVLRDKCSPHHPPILKLYLKMQIKVC